MSKAIASVHPMTMDTWMAIVERAWQLWPQRIPLPPLTKQLVQKIPGQNSKRRSRAGTWGVRLTGRADVIPDVNYSRPNAEFKTHIRPTTTDRFKPAFSSRRQPLRQQTQDRYHINTQTFTQPFHSDKPQRVRGLVSGGCPGVDLNESYDGSPALRRKATGPGVDCQTPSRNMFNEQASDVFNGSQV